MFLKIVGARSAEQSGIKGVKKPFDPNITILQYWAECLAVVGHSASLFTKVISQNPCWHEMLANTTGGLIQ